MSRAFREGLIAAFPALEGHEYSLYYRRMVQYLLYATMRDEESGRIVVPAGAVAQMADKKVSHSGFAAVRYLDAFSRDVWTLQVEDYVAHVRARTVAFDMPEALLFLPPAQGEGDQDDLVWLVSGLPVTPSSRRKAAARYEEGLGLLGDGVPLDHPAYELMDYLNSQSQRALSTRVRANWDRLQGMYEALPETTNHEWHKKQSVRYTLDALEDWCKLFYSPCRSTARVQARGVTIHNLPRAFRKAALAGAVEMDIRSSQLAIVARVWDLPGVRAFCASGRSFWAEMTDYLSLSDDRKPILKDAIYSACFGMGRKNLVRRLAEGYRDKEGIGAAAARKFMAHPLVKELLRGRKAAMDRVRDAGGVTDAFGRFLPLSHEHPAHALLAIEAQSWELRLMLPIFEVAREVRDLSILSWLHDGVALYHRDDRGGRREGWTEKIKSSFDANAQSLGFPTDLEVTFL